MSDDHGPETQLALMNARIVRLEKETEELEQAVKDMDTRDRSRMRAAIVTLGGLVLSLVSYIWAKFGGGSP